MRKILGNPALVLCMFVIIGSAIQLYIEQMEYMTVTGRAPSPNAGYFSGMSAAGLAFAGGGGSGGHSPGSTIGDRLGHAGDPVAEDEDDKDDDECWHGGEACIKAELNEPERLPRFDFDQFAHEVRNRRFDSAAVLGTLAAALGVGTMPKTPAELRGLGVSKNKLNLYTSQLSRWSGRLGNRSLRELGRTSGGIVIGGASTGLLIFEGFYNWGVIGSAALNATTFQRDDGD